MKIWWKDPILWLMVCSYIFVMYLCAAWIQSSYALKYTEILQQGQSHYTSVVRLLEDSLIQVNHKNGTYRHRPRPEDPDKHLDVTVKRERERERSNAPNFRKHLRIFLDKNQKQSGFVGSLGMHLAAVKNAEDRSGKAIDFEIIHLLDQHVTQHFEASSFPGDFVLGVFTFREDTLRDITHSYTDLFTGSDFGITINPHRASILKSIASFILFAVAVLLLVLFSFVLTYRALRKKERLSKLKNDLISNITHELKTPISTVKVALEAISGFDKNTNSDKQKEYLDISKMEVDRLSLLVESVLQTSKSESGQLALQPQVFDIRVLIEGILHKMKVQFQNNNAKVQFIFDQGLWNIKADKSHITSVIYNLLDNALKYGGTPPKIDIALQKSDDNIQIHVKDNGVGIPKIYQPNIFEKFFRVPTGDVHDTKGHGLGLTYVADVVKKHLGNIQVTSSPGQGSTFIINLPNSYVKI